MMASPAPAAPVCSSTKDADPTVSSFIVIVPSPTVTWFQLAVSIAYRSNSSNRIGTGTTSGPLGPEGPLGPDGPCGPLGPVAPTGPVSPAGPTGPVSPAGPVAPVIPS